MSDEPSLFQLSNGLIVISQHLPNAASVAYELSIPGGIVCDNKVRLGESLILAELLGRGAGPYNSRALSNEFDKLGIRHSETAMYDRFCLRGLCLAGDEGRGMELLTQMLLEPHLPGDQLENIKQLILFDMDALADAPAERASIKLLERYFPDPHGRSPYGDRDGVLAIKPEDIVKAFNSKIKPEGAVLSLSGAYCKPELPSQLEDLFSRWKGKAETLPKYSGVQAGFYEHLREKSAQMYLAMAIPSVPCTHPYYYVVRLLNEILSGGMYGRLFLEIREKRGLCYSISSRYSANAEQGALYVFASTTSENAGQLLKVLFEELGECVRDISQQELERAKTNLKTALLLANEGVASRCAANSNDWWIFKKVRSLEEINYNINAVEKADIIKYLESFSGSALSLVSLGSRKLKGLKIR